MTDLHMPGAEKIQEAVEAFAGNGWNVHLAGSAKEGRARLLDLVPAGASVVLRPGLAWARLAADADLSLRANVTVIGDGEPEDARRRILDADVGITGATALVLETATALLAADDPWTQLVSGLPYTHIVVAPVFKLVDNLPQGLALVRSYSELALRKPFPRYLGGVSGPSRTGDIEMIIVQGMHGPAKVHLLLLDVEPLPGELGGFPAEFLMA